MISEKRLRDRYYNIIKPRGSENLDDENCIEVPIEVTFWRTSMRTSMTLKNRTSRFHRGYVSENLDENLDDAKTLQKPFIELPSKLCFGEPRWESR